MSENVVVCPQCSLEFPQTTKFCGSCGGKTEVPNLTSASEQIPQYSEDVLLNLRVYLNGLIENGDNPLDDFEAICEDFFSLGVPKEITLTEIQKFSESQTKSVAKIKLFYDAINAKRGIANGATGLELKIENISNSGVASISVSITHPEELTKIDLEKIVSLGKGKSREIVKSLRLSTVGQHFVHGEVLLSLLNGSVEVYRFANPIRLSTENSNVSRLTHMSQTITTNGGGIINESGMGGMTGSSQSMAKEWELVRLVAVNLANHTEKIENQTLPNSSPSDNLSGISAPPEEATPALPVNPSLLESKGESLIEKGASRKIELGESYNLPEGYANEALESLYSHQKKLISDILPSLLLIFAQSQISKRVSVYKALDIHFSLLKKISKIEIAPGEHLKMSDIYALAVKSAGDDGEELESFAGKATALTSRGFFIYSSEFDDVVLETSYDWPHMATLGWEVSRQIFAPGSEIVSIGSSVDDPLPSLTFDLRKSESKVDVASLAERIDLAFSATLILQKTIDSQMEQIVESNTEEPAEDLVEDTTNDLTPELNEDDSSSPQHDFNEIESVELVKQSIENVVSNSVDDTVNEESSNNQSEELADEITEADELEDDGQLEDDELTIAARSFFAMFAFVSQRCNEAYDRPLHLLIEEDDGGDISLDLAQTIQSLFPNSKLIAISEEDLDSEHDEEGRLSGWRGPATAITRDGVFHIDSSGDGEYALDGKNSFLSWQKLFGELKAGLMIRDDIPDIWIGTNQTLFIRGTYVDYSNHINEWIYFNDFVRKEFLERLRIFKDEI